MPYLIILYLLKMDIPVCRLIRYQIQVAKWVTIVTYQVAMAIIKFRFNEWISNWRSRFEQGS